MPTNQCEEPTLYRPESTITLFNGYHDVLITWFVPKRDQPVVRYGALVGPRSSTNPKTRARIDEFMTAKEVEQLDQYLQSLGETRFVANKLNHPAKVQGAIQRPYGGRIELSQTEDYDLPFEVSGMFYECFAKPKHSEPTIARQRIDSSVAAICESTGELFIVHPPYRYFLQAKPFTYINPTAVSFPRNVPEMEDGQIIGQFEITPRDFPVLAPVSIEVEAASLTSSRELIAPEHSSRPGMESF